MDDYQEYNAERIAVKARDDLHKVGSAFSGLIRKRLILWAGRSGIGLALAITAARFVEWLWWLPWASLAIASVSLVAILVTGRLIADKIGATEKTIARAEEAIARIEETIARTEAYPFARDEGARDTRE